MKALHESGNEVIAIPYLGDSIETPWWRTYRNPCAVESKIYNRLTRGGSSPRGGSKAKSDPFTNALVSKVVRPKWKRQLANILGQERDVDSVLLLNVPVNHFTGLPSFMREEFGVNVAYYDGDMPTILPRFADERGFKFNYYEGADLTEYDLFFSNSKGALPELLRMGARRVQALYWGVDPELFKPLGIETDYDVSFYGHGDQLRREWMARMISEPSLALPHARFVVGGSGFKMSLGRAETVGSVPYSGFRRFVCRSRINLNITRSSHTNVYASATSRPFELAAQGACIVSQPYSGIEEWFDVGREIVIVKSAEDAIEAYSWLLDDPESAKAMGAAARRRVLSEHTFHHRAREIEQAIGGAA